MLYVCGRGNGEGDLRVHALVCVIDVKGYLDSAKIILSKCRKLVITSLFGISCL